MTTNSSATYLHVILKIRPGMMARFNTLMTELREHAEARGWKLEGAWVTTIGRLNTVVDLWRIPDANSVPSMLMQLASLPDWPRLEPELAACVEDEVTQVVAKLPYSP